MWSVKWANFGKTVKQTNKHVWTNSFFPPQKIKHIFFFLQSRDYFSNTYKYAPIYRTVLSNYQSKHRSVHLVINHLNHLKWRLSKILGTFIYFLLFVRIEVAVLNPCGTCPAPSMFIHVHTIKHTQIQHVFGKSESSSQKILLTQNPSTIIDLDQNWTYTFPLAVPLRTHGGLHKPHFKNQCSRSQSQKEQTSMPFVDSSHVYTDYGFDPSRSVTSKDEKTAVKTGRKNGLYGRSTTRFKSNVQKYDGDVNAASLSFKV